MNKYLIVVVVSVLALSGCDSQEQVKQKQVKQIIKPNYSTIYDYCKSLSSYDTNGVMSLKESNARMFLERDNVSNPENYITYFGIGAGNGHMAKLQGNVDGAISSYLGSSSTANTAFVPTCVQYIQSTIEKYRL